MTGAYDFVIVGAGAAGCILANRLTEDPHVRVLLVEAGGKGFAPIAEIPLAVGALRGNVRYDWRYETEPEPFLGNRSLSLPQGRSLGGSSAINGMVYVRARPSDFEDWERSGVKGWSWSDVVPYFEKAEGRRAAENRAAFHVTPGSSMNPLDTAFVEAGVSVGYPRSLGFNTELPDGFGFFDFNIRGGRRWTAWQAYLRPALARPNLELRTNALVHRLRFNGKRAVGVEWGRSEKAWAGEVLLSAGSIGSPKLLMLSGVGEPNHLRKFGISTVSPLPEVGENLQNHPDVALRYACSQKITLHSLLRADRMALAMARAWFAGSGPAAGFPGNAGAFIRTDPRLEQSNLECHLVWANRIAGARVRAPLRPRKYAERDGFSIRISLLRPTSRGLIRLASADPLAPPVIRFNYLSSSRDCLALVRGLRMMREVVGQSAFDPFRGLETEPGPTLTAEDDLSTWVRAHADTQGHPVGTCRMGGGENSVVDCELRVRGLECIRVVDASIMPVIPHANTFATTSMIAEKASDLICGRTTKARLSERHMGKRPMLSPPSTNKVCPVTKPASSDRK